MRRGLLQDYANQVCHVVVSWICTYDFPVLMESGQGTIALDLLTGSVTADEMPVPRLGSCDEAISWFHEARNRDHLPGDLIQAFHLRLDHRIIVELAEPSEVRHVHLDASSELTTPDETLVGKALRRERWARSGPGSHWIVHDQLDPGSGQDTSSTNDPDSNS